MNEFTVTGSAIHKENHSMFIKSLFVRRRSGKLPENEGRMLLNSEFLSRRIQELGFKQWWLAEQIGVDRKTVSRWLKGQVKSVQLENLLAMAKVLGCEIDDLVVENSTELMSTPEDQKAAAALLVTSSLLDKLGPIGEWNVIESLLKATLVANLPLHLLGDLYAHLTIASWRQGKIEQAELYNQKLFEIATRSQSENLRARALLNQANFHSWRGETRLAIDVYERILELGEALQPRGVASAYSNLGAVYIESGEYLKGEEKQLLAIAIFDEYGKAMNLSIAHCHLAMSQLSRGDLSTAANSNRRARAEAERDGYRRGLEMAKLIEAELAARIGDRTIAEGYLTSALQGFAQLGIHEALTQVYAARVYRLLGRHDEAMRSIEIGKPLAKDFPLELASLYFEEALVCKDGDSARARRAGEKAVETFLNCQCPRRADEVTQALSAKNDDVP